MFSFKQPNHQVNSGKILNQAIVEKFSQADIKIAIQKSGHIASISKKIIQNYLKIKIKESEQDSRLIVTVSENSNYTVGFYFAKNRSIAKLVASHAVDIGVVGGDQLVEAEVDHDIKILKTYESVYSWPLVLATPANSDKTDFKDIKRIATQYPQLVKKFLQSINRLDIEIIPTIGSTEAMCYTKFHGKAIDAIIDICKSGKTMTANGMKIWEPAVTHIYPIVIANKNFATNPAKLALLKLND